jgi:hypothetical protein
MSNGSEAEGGEKAEEEEDRVGGSGGPRKSSTSTNPSRRGDEDNPHGFAATTPDLRPPTRAMVGYPLLCYLNRKKCGTADPSANDPVSAAGVDDVDDDDDDDDDDVGSSDDDGTRTEISRSSSSWEWRWVKKGQFVAIGVLYRRGWHYATNIKDFTPILKHLRRLHAHGAVHGDVRGFNMAMINENEGFLIDLDYGGKVICDVGNPPRYPEGYNYLLVDGARDKRPERSPITRKDDLQAMTNFMCRLYVPTEFQGSAELDRRQRELVKGVGELEVGNVDAALMFNDALVQFADDGGWSVMPATGALLEALESIGYDMKKSAGRAGKRPVGTDPATGSPSKPQRR